MSSKILNTAPLAQINDSDCAPGSYPEILRTGDSQRLGNTQVIFDDSKTQLGTPQNVLMPYNISARDAALSNFSTGSITLVKVPSLSSQFLTKFDDGDAISPYDESKNVAAFFTETQNAGTPTSVYPGFDSPVSSKIAIVIDITSTATKKVFKMLSTRAVDTNGLFYNESGTGFLYYNFDTNEWDDIGLKDPATGATTGYDFMMKKASTDLIVGKNNEYMCQFMPSPSVALSPQLTKVGDLKSIGYDKIGTPTAFFGAPNAPRYHASEEQTLKLSNYIQHPFVLEKAYLELPTIGSRIQNGGSPYPKGFFRDIVNYVFFMYKQNRAGNVAKDTVADVSSSIRSLVLDGSFCYYNSASISAGVGPQHEHGAAFDHAMGTSTFGTSTLIGNVSMLMSPKIYNEQLTGLSPLPYTTQAPPVSSGETVNIQNFWTGGTKGYNVSGSLSQVGKVSNRSINSYTGVNSINNPQISLQDLKVNIDPRAMKSSVWRSDQVVRINSYYTASNGPPIQFYQCTDDTTNYKNSPYILFPSDELVFGIDAGQTTISSYPGILPVSSQDENALQITGSYLTIPANPARIILYGSLIRENKEQLPSLNQNLTSDAIHEDLHEVIVDQFDIAERILYSGSYLDSYYTGSMTSTKDRVYVGRASMPPVYPNYAFNRFATMASTSERFTKSDQLYPIVNFRANHFGHFRDILEQTKDSEKITVEFVKKSTSFLNFSMPRQETKTSGPALCLFVSQSSETIVDPITTRSSNLSTAFTCSLPYFEGEARNRSEIISGSNSPFRAQTVILNKPSTLLSST